MAPYLPPKVKRSLKEIAFTKLQGHDVYMEALREYLQNAIGHKELL